MKEQRLKKASGWRRRFERWIIRRFAVQYGPYMYCSRDTYIFVDYRGNVWRLIPTDDLGDPLVIQLEERR